MTRDERKALINKPFPPYGLTLVGIPPPVIARMQPPVTIVSHYPWAGTLIGDINLRTGEDEARLVVPRVRGDRS